MFRLIFTILLLLARAEPNADGWYIDRGFLQETAAHHDLPPGVHLHEIERLFINENDEIVLVSDKASVVYQSGDWQMHPSIRLPQQPNTFPPGTLLKNLTHHVKHGWLAAGKNGLYESQDGIHWDKVEAPDGLGRVWGQSNVLAATWDGQGRLWFGVLAGIACRQTSGEWRFFEGKDGLPFNQFTCALTDSRGFVWFGTTRGAVIYDGKEWHYRQGKRWVIHDAIKAIASDSKGRVWLATPAGLTSIDFRSMTLMEKANHYEEQIENVIKRTEYGYLCPVRLQAPGDTSQPIRSDSDNDGLWTSMYGASQCFAFAATEDFEYKLRARAAFKALAFLQDVTQGTRHSPPAGYVARTIRSTSLPDPNEGRLERDEKRRQTEDALWKTYEPRWPKSRDGKWYWKSDTSSDELDGHYFFYALYHDLVAESAEEQARVRNVVAMLTDHLIENDYQLVDHDGRATRWGIFDPANLNHNENWYVERGLNSMSLLSYLTVAHHVTNDRKYRDHAERLMEKHGYHTNAMIPKLQRGIGSGNQSDDEMAFMNFYNLMHYSWDESLKQRLLKAFYSYWILEQPELNPFFNFAYASCASGKTVSDPWGQYDMSPWPSMLKESLATLRGFPLDRANWSHTNSHRLDLTILSKQQSVSLLGASSRVRGHKKNGLALPVAERHFNHWNTDPYQLDYPGDGRVLGCGTVYLLPYYMGLYHDFITLPQ